MSCSETSEDPRAALVDLLAEIRACRVCAQHFDHEPRPVVRVDPRARIVVSGQAPGVRVHEFGAPFVDPSGERLRDWMGVDEAAFYDPAKIAVIPAGFCFPGYTAAGADKPPRPECAPLWHGRLFALLARVELIILAGAYGQNAYLGKRAKPTMTETVAAWRDYAPLVAPTPHPSWRNNAWMKKNPWFEAELVPDLRARVARVLRTP